VLTKDPALLDTEARQYASYPGGHAEGFADTFKQLYKAVYSYLDAGDMTATPDFPTFEDGHQALVVCEAILRSAREGRRVEVDS
jgi:predicted dehydrogenase